MSDHPALVDLPAAYRALFPLIDELDLPEETRSTCASCPQAAPPEGATADRPYLADVRCCTYQPSLPNFLAGRALARGGVGADRIRARLAEPEGVSAAAIRGPDALRRRYSSESFGRDRALTCPFWVPGDLSCSIWRDRNAVCRTWFCRTTHGDRSIRLWEAVRDLLTTLEQRLALHLADHPGAPDPDTATPVAWEAWYRDCHARLEALGDRAADVVDLPERAGLEVALRVYRELLEAPVPERVRPVVHALVPEPDGFVITGYSSLDRVRVPRTFMALLGLLAEGVPWREALDRVRSDYGITFEDGFIEQLWDRGVLTFDVDADRPPEVAAWEALSAQGPLDLDRPGEVRPPEPG